MHCTFSLLHWRNLGNSAVCAREWAMETLQLSAAILFQCLNILDTYLTSVNAGVTAVLEELLWGLMLFWNLPRSRPCTWSGKYAVSQKLIPVCMITSSFFREQWCWCSMELENGKSWTWIEGFFFLWFFILFGMEIYLVSCVKWQ